jgi:glycosyltransferase involved in cell wall biosynthesis
VKIAIVTQYYSPEAIRIPDTLARRLVSSGHQVRVITGYPNYPDGQLFSGYRQRLNHVEMIEGVQVRRVPLFISHSYNPIARFLNYLTYAWSTVFAHSWVRSADIVYVYATQMTPAIGPSLWRAFFRLPYVLHVQDLWPESVTGSSMVGGGVAKKVIAGILNPWLRFLYRTASATIAIAPSMARMLVERGVPEERIRTVFNWSGVEPSSREMPADKHSETVSIVYAGNFGDHQSLDNVIHAANAVRDIEKLHITLVGSGVADRRLRELAASLDVPNVTFAGRVPPEAMGRIHSGSDFQIVSLSNLDIFEGTIPSKLQASISHGIPVITAVRGDVKRLVQENGIGFACDPDDPNQLAEAFRKAAALSPAARASMAKAARLFYGTSMSLDSGVSQIEAILYSASRQARSKDNW